MVSENIFLYRPGNKWKPTETWGVQEVLNKFEIQDVSQVIDFLGMMGDAVDNIPGLPGVGEKTAKKLLAEYGNMETLLDNAHEVKGKLGEKIQTYKDQGLLSKRLATILLDAPVEIDEVALAVKKFDTEKVQSLFEELEFRNLAKRLLGQIEMPDKVEIGDSNTIQKTSSNDGQMDLFAIGDDYTPPTRAIKRLKT